MKFQNFKISVEWRNIDYNYGNCFDGKYFTVPENGLYYFHVACRQKSDNVGTARIYVNNNEQIKASRGESTGNYGFITLNTTLKLFKNDKVNFSYHYMLNDTSDSMTNYAEGRLIARLDK